LFGRGIFLAHAASLQHTTFFARPKSVTFLHSFNRRVWHPRITLGDVRKWYANPICGAKRRKTISAPPAGSQAC
jgi:hypothetical protein